jgi:hypothetical protein
MSIYREGIETIRATSSKPRTLFSENGDTGLCAAKHPAFQFVGDALSGGWQRQPGDG